VVRNRRRRAREGREDVDILSSFRQDDSYIGFIDHSTLDGSHDRDLRDIFSFALIKSNIVFQRCIPPKGEAVIPAPHDGITGLEFEDTVLRCLQRRVERGRGCSAKVRRGYVADDVVIVDVADTGREVEGESGDDVVNRALVKGLCLVGETGEVTLENGTTVTQMNLILDVLIGTPVTDLSEPLQLGDLQDRLVIYVVDGESLLVLVNKVGIG